LPRPAPPAQLGVLESLTEVFGGALDHAAGLAGGGPAFTRFVGVTPAPGDFSRVRPHGACSASSVPRLKK